ncbi:MAG: DEAD/DEAH box helicase [Candidatus Nanopelagicales bacterium]
MALDGHTGIVASRRGIDEAGWYRVRLLFGVAASALDEFELAPAILLEQALALRGLLSAHEVGLEVDEPVEALLRRHLNDQRGYAEAQTYEVEDDATVETVPRVIRDLRPFQLRDFSKLRRLRHGANFSVPGAGKTTVTYALHADAAEQRLVEKLLVVAPLSAFGAWEEDAMATLDPAPTVRRWVDHTPDSDVVLINYQRLKTAAPSLVRWMLEHPVHLVIDEAHRAKRGATGEWGRTLLDLSPLAVRRDVLTGTPAPNHPKDLRALLEILWPSTAAAALPEGALRPEPSDTAMTAVSRHIAPLYVRTTKEELGLRPPDIQMLKVEMGDVQRQIYEAMLSRYAGTLDLNRRDAAMFAQLGDIAMYLLQAASSPRLLSSSASAGRAYRYPSLAIPDGTALAGLLDSYATHEIASKIETVCRLVHANVQLDRKTLVWSNFPTNLLDLEQQLESLSPALVYGSIESAEEAPPGVRTREREIARFKDPNSDCKVLLANPAAMSEGISLHSICHDAIYMDRSFNAGQYLQSLDRIHRLGLGPDEETRITVLASAGTIDERIARRLEEKTRRLSHILDDPALLQMSLPDEEDTGDVLDDELDIEQIMEHLAHGFPDDLAYGS